MFFDALHVAGLENTIADGISRWEPEDIDGNLRAFRPDVAAVVSPSLFDRFPVLGRFSGVDRGGCVF